VPSSDWTARHAEQHSSLHAYWFAVPEQSPTWAETSRPSRRSKLRSNYVAVVCLICANRLFVRLRSSQLACSRRCSNQPLKLNPTERNVGRTIYDLRRCTRSSITFNSRSVNNSRTPQDDCIGSKINDTQVLMICVIHVCLQRKFSAVPNYRKVFVQRPKHGSTYSDIISGYVF
jgi:hypothetical protein